MQSPCVDLFRKGTAWSPHDRFISNITQQHLKKELPAWFAILKASHSQKCLLSLISNTRSVGLYLNFSWHSSVLPCCMQFKKRLARDRHEKRYFMLSLGNLRLGTSRHSSACVLSARPALSFDEDDVGMDDFMHSYHIAGDVALQSMQNEIKPSPKACN